MNRVILPLIALGALIATPSALAQYTRYDGEDPVQRQMRLSRERDEANAQAAKLAAQAAQVESMQREIEKLKKHPVPTEAPSLEDLLRRDAAEKEFKARVNESWARVYARYPALKQEGNPWRKKLEVYIPRQSAKPSKTKLFMLSDWPERIVLEFGQLNGLIDPKGNPVVR